MSAIELPVWTPAERDSFFAAIARVREPNVVTLREPS